MMLIIRLRRFFEQHMFGRRKCGELGASEQTVSKRISSIKSTKSPKHLQAAVLMSRTVISIFYVSSAIDVQL